MARLCREEALRYLLKCSLAGDDGKPAAVVRPHQLLRAVAQLRATSSPSLEECTCHLVTQVFLTCWITNI